jgi:hypothetical protein
LTRTPHKEILVRSMRDSDAAKLDVARRLMAAIQAGDVAAVDAL